MNAPRELAEILQDWMHRPSNRTIYTVHGSSDTSAADHDMWLAQARAVKLWTMVQETLSAMENNDRVVAHYRRWEDMWMQCIFAPDTHWGEATSGSLNVIANQGAVDALWSLADVIESDLQRFALVHREQSTAALDEILALLDDDQLGLGPNDKRYLFELVDAVRSALSEATMFNGLQDLRSRINELVGHLTVIADLADDEGQTGLSVKLRDLGRRVRPWSIRGAVFAAGVLGAAADIKEITT